MQRPTTFSQPPSVRTAPNSPHQQRYGKNLSESFKCLRHTRRPVLSLESEIPHLSINNVEPLTPKSLGTKKDLNAHFDEIQASFLVKLDTDYDNFLKEEWAAPKTLNFDVNMFVHISNIWGPHAAMRIQSIVTSSRKQ